MYYAYCCSLALILSIFGMMRDSPGNTTLLGDFSHPLFLWCFQMARIILNMEMDADVDFEPDLLNNRILLHVLDRTLTITIIND